MAFKAFLFLLATSLFVTTRASSHDLHEELKIKVSSDDIMDEKSKWKPFLRPFRRGPAKQPTEQSFIPKSRAPRPRIGLPKLPPLTFNIPLPGRTPVGQQKQPPVGQQQRQPPVFQQPQQPQVGQQPPVGEQQQPPVEQRPFPPVEGEFGPEPLRNDQIPNPLLGNKVGEEELKLVMKGRGFSNYNMTLARPVTPANRSFKARPFNYPANLSFKERPVTPTTVRVKAPPVTPANLSVKA
ncbi:hypothetical protein M0R45_033556 [Rubus argutus]|uniref:Uncharacterized protein n=1 Tax=Rubus argutus TaxID=59490 RepID=A0AAW1WN74_RUBAR